MTNQQIISMTGGEAAVAQLVAEGVEVIFGIPGAHNAWLCDAVHDHPRLRFVGGRHEQSMTLMANGYARASGRIAVPLVVSGPGVTNTLTSLADAYADAVPMVVVASAPDPRDLGKGAFHELKDQTAALASVTKWNAYITQATMVPGAIRTAFAEAYGGRPGPVAVEIPVNVQTEQAQVEIQVPSPPVSRRADPDAVRDAARRLHAAAFPMVLAGPGAARPSAAAPLISLVEHLKAPCLTTPLARGTVPTDHPLSLNGCLVAAGLGRSLLEEADVLLVVGSGLTEVDTNQWTLPLPENLIHIDSCSATIGRSYPATVPMVGDVTTVLAQLLEELVGRGTTDRPSPAPRIAEVKTRAAAALRRNPAWDFVAAMQEALPDDAIVTNDAAGANGWILACLERSLPRTLNITRNLGALGFAFPAAVGAKLACPECQAVAVAGDGGFLFTADALATAVQYGLNAVAVIFNDNAYGTIKDIQLGQFGRHIGVELTNPDFVKLAEAYGAAGRRAETPRQLGDALNDAFAREMPTVIEVPLETGMPPTAAMTNTRRRKAP